jgi:hypothetical protein
VSVIAGVEAVEELRGKLGRAENWGDGCGRGGSGVNRGNEKGVEDVVKEALGKAEKDREAREKVSEQERKERERELRLERLENERKECKEREERDREQKERERERRLEKLEQDRIKKREENERRGREKGDSDCKAVLKILQEQQNKQDIEEGVRREIARMSGISFMAQNAAGYGSYGGLGAWSNGLAAPVRQGLLAAPIDLTEHRLSRLETMQKQDEWDRDQERERFRRSARWS